jgi:hypothetical protein
MEEIGDDIWCIRKKISHKMPGNINNHQCLGKNAWSAAADKLKRNGSQARNRFHTKFLYVKAWLWMTRAEKSAKANKVDRTIG